MTKKDSRGLRDVIAGDTAICTCGIEGQRTYLLWLYH